MEEEDSPRTELGATESTGQGNYQEVKPGPKQSESSKYLNSRILELLQPALCLLCVSHSSEWKCVMLLSWLCSTVRPWMYGEHNWTHMQTIA